MTNARLSNFLSTFSPCEGGFNPCGKFLVPTSLTARVESGTERTFSKSLHSSYLNRRVCQEFFGGVFRRILGKTSELSNYVILRANKSGSDPLNKSPCGFQSVSNHIHKV
jgi:hypothetical protein